MIIAILKIDDRARFWSIAINICGIDIAMLREQMNAVMLKIPATVLDVVRADEAIDTVPLPMPLEGDLIAHLIV